MIVLVWPFLIVFCILRDLLKFWISMARESEHWPICPSSRKLCSRLSSPLTSWPSFRSHMKICWIISLPTLHFSGQQCKRRAGEVELQGRAANVPSEDPLDLLPNDSTSVCFFAKKKILTLSRSRIFSILCMNAGLVIELHIHQTELRRFYSLSWIESFIFYAYFLLVYTWDGLHSLSNERLHKLWFYLCVPP